ncbi:MAG TPA: hypothetical protein DDZ84_04520 [Firmicutes bacterium]|jgi:cytoskeletal protein CcmA (bactofilin family)|nr:hypothetical protein [Bacillota bacterium]
MRNLCTDQKGGTMVYVLVAMVVLSLTIMGMLQMALASYQTGKFMEQRRQALAAAESGVALAVAELGSGTEVPRASYSSTSAPSIDSAAKAETGWIGPTTGAMPSELSLGPGISFRVWVAQPVSDRTLVVAEGRSGGRTRLVQVRLKPRGRIPPFVVSATSQDHRGITLNGSGSITGDMHTEGLRSDSVMANGSVKSSGALYVRRDARVEEIRNRVGRYFEDGVQVDPEEYEYPMPVAPSGLPYRGRVTANGWDPVSISESGEYDSFLINGSCDFNVDTTAGDVVLHVKGDFTINGSVRLNIVGSHSFRVYVDGDFTWNGCTKGAALDDPTRFVVCCRGRRVVLNGSPSLAAVIYAPQSDITFNGSGTFTGAVVGKEIVDNGTGSLIFPAEYRDKITDVYIGTGSATPVIETGSWSELSQGTN